MADDRLILARAEVRRIEKSLRIVKRLLAQEIDSTAGSHNDSPGGHTNERDGDQAEGH